MCECIPQCDSLLINPFPLVSQLPLIGRRHVTWSGGREGAGLADSARETRGHTELPCPPSAGCSHHNQGEGSAAEADAGRAGLLSINSSKDWRRGGEGGRGRTSTGHESRSLRTQPRGPGVWGLRFYQTGSAWRCLDGAWARF